MFKYYRLIKDVFAAKKLENGMIRLVKIKNGEVYKYYPQFNFRKNTVYLCKNVRNSVQMIDAIKMPSDYFEKYFERKLIAR